VTTIGNFVYDIPGMFWISFGIWALDGLFVLYEIDHKIDRGGFTTTMTLQSEGINPLAAPAPKPVTAQDWAAQAGLKFSAAWASGTIPRTDQEMTQGIMNSLTLPENQLFQQSRDETQKDPFPVPKVPYTKM
jgi:hypothetical protein